MKRKLLIAANWKMHPPPAGWDAADSPYRPRKEIDVAVFPAHLDLPACIAAGIPTGIQAARPEETGAFTGDLSMAMAKRIGCAYALCGHSDRRRFHGETDAFVSEQAAAAIMLGMIPIVCIGETAAERAAGKTKEVLKRQVNVTMDHSQLRAQASKLVLAYEPVWAISRGDANVKAATSADAEEAHAFIRSLLAKELRESVRILYGGSMNAKNASELLSQPNIDGGLVGGASLKIHEFTEIVRVASSMES